MRYYVRCDAISPAVSNSFSPKSTPVSVPVSHTLAFPVYGILEASLCVAIGSSDTNFLHLYFIAQLLQLAASCPKIRSQRTLRKGEHGATGCIFDHARPQVCWLVTADVVLVKYRICQISPEPSWLVTDDHGCR